MGFELDEEGFLLKPEIHDGYLVAIELPGEGIARLTLENLSGERFALQMEQVDRLLCDGFAEGNIVREIRITTGREPGNEPLRRLLGELDPSARNPISVKTKNGLSKRGRQLLMERRLL